MEIGALSSSPATRHYSRAAADGAAEQVKQLSRNATDAGRSQSEARKAAAEASSNKTVDTPPREVRESRDVQKANASAAGAIPRILFKDSGGTRVMEVYDSKDILIYQVPSKGLLALIHNQENRPDPQVETAA